MRFIIYLFELRIVIQ